MAHRKQRMQGMVDQVNANADSGGDDILSKQERKVSRLKKRGYVKSGTTGEGEVQLRQYKKKKVKRKGVSTKGKTTKYATTKSGIDHTTREMIGKKAYRKTVKRNK